jgi:hypothetical protein
LIALAISFGADLHGQLRVISAVYGRSAAAIFFGTFQKVQFKRLREEQSATELARFGQGSDVLRLVDRTF